MRPSFIEWAESRGGLYVHDKPKPELAIWQDYQRRILNHLFPAGEGRLPYSEIMWSEPKKSGKTLLAAGLHLYFALFIEVPGEQYVLANDLEGASDRTWQAIKGSLEKAAKMQGSGIRDSDFRVVGTKIMISNGTKISALANDYKGGAGGNHSFATVDEVWGFVSQAHLGLLTEFGPVPTRENSVTFYLGYQGYESDDPHWHRMIDSVMENGAPVAELADIDDGEGRPACWSDGRTFLFYSHWPRMPWHTDAFLAERQKRLPTAEYLRTYHNQRVKNASPLCTEEQWDALLDGELREFHPGDDRMIVLGADAATKRDCCALIGTTWNAAQKRVEICYARIWTPDKHHPLDLDDTLANEIIALHRTGKLRGCWFDPFQMMAVASRLRKEGVKMYEFQQTTRRIESDTLLRDMIIGRNISHYGPPEVREHVLNASVKMDSERGVRIIKKDQKKPIDASVATGIAVKACMEEFANKPDRQFLTATNPFYR